MSANFGPKMKVHFMGIKGSGVDGVAKLSKKLGYEVTGCDLELEGHDKSHTEGVDLVVATPAVFYQSKDEPEFIEATRKRILITWQEFLGKYLHKNKKVICIAGTHGKSTTTGMVIKLLEDAGLDPLAILGAKLIPSGENYRFGKGDYFVTEADEFHDNFLNYYPDIIILNNIEFDHPDYFKSEAQVFESFKKFVGNLVRSKVLIVNKEDKGIQKLLKNADTKGLKLIEYSFKENKRKLNLKVPGNHNVTNALGVIELGKVLGINGDLVIKSLEGFKGVGRRLELVSDNKNIHVYDDYAHHPTAIKATLQGLRELYPKSRIWAVVEAHGYQRTKATLPLYNGAFHDADIVAVGPVFKARDHDTFGITSEVIAKASGHKNAMGFESLEELLGYLSKNLKNGDVVLVMGAGKSNIWAQKISQI